MTDFSVLIQLWFLGALIDRAHCELISCSAGISFDERNNRYDIYIRMYVDECANDDVVEDLSILITEIIANFPDDYFLAEEEIIRLPNVAAVQTHHPILLFRRPVRRTCEGSCDN